MKRGKKYVISCLWGKCPAAVDRHAWRNAALILLNEVARRTKAGGTLMFFVIPAVLTVYFIAIAVGAKTGASWALKNQTYLYMNGWFHYAKLYAALAGCIGFMMIKYEWGIGKSSLV